MIMSQMKELLFVSFLMNNYVILGELLMKEIKEWVLMKINQQGLVQVLMVKVMVVYPIDLCKDCFEKDLLFLVIIIISC